MSRSLWSLHSDLTEYYHLGFAPRQLEKMRGKHDLNPALSSLNYLILIIGLVNHNGNPSQRSQWLFFIAIASISIYMTFFCASSNPTSDYLNICPLTTFFFASSDLLLLRKYNRELQPLGQKPLSKMPFKDRLLWAASLSGNRRGIGWTHEPTRYLPPRPSSTPVKFILSQLMWMVFYFLQFDITNMLVRANPCFATGGPSLTAFGWLWRSTVLLYVSLMYCMLSLLYTACSIVSVAVGMSEPRDWPDLFGSFLEAYTLRNCWGRVWHQMLRKMVTSHADFITKQLRLPKSTFTTGFKLFMAFFVSGLIHYSAEYTFYQNWSGRAMEFFLLQAVGITCEGIIISLAVRAGFSSKPNIFYKFIGFVWVFAWFTYSLPIMLDNMVHAGLMDGGWNFSLILGLWRRRSG